MAAPSNNAGGPDNAAQIDYRILSTVSDYGLAQEIVDRLSDNGFPVEKVRIVGSGLRTVE